MLSCRIDFEGHFRRRDGSGMATYELELDGHKRRRELAARARDGREVEYLALLEGVADLLALLQAAGRQPSEFRLVLRPGTSAVFGRLLDRKRLPSREANALFQEATTDLARFADVRLIAPVRSRSKPPAGRSGDRGQRSYSRQAHHKRTAGTGPMRRGLAPT